MKRLFMQKLKVYLFVYTQFWWNYRGFLKKITTKLYFTDSTFREQFYIFKFKQLCSHVQFTSDPYLMWFLCIFRGLKKNTTELHFIVSTLEKNFIF